MTSALLLTVAAMIGQSNDARQQVIDQIESGSLSVVFIGVPARIVPGNHQTYHAEDLWGFDRKNPAMVVVMGKGNRHAFEWEPGLLDSQIQGAIDKAVGILSPKQERLSLKQNPFGPEIVFEGAPRKKKPLDTIDLLIPSDMKLPHPKYKLIKGTKRDPKTFYRDLWYADDDQEQLRAVLAAANLKLPLMHFYKSQDFTRAEDWEKPWRVPGGLEGVYGWRSFLAVSDPPISGTFTEGEPYEKGQIALDMLVDAKTFQLFGVNHRIKGDGKHWFNYEEGHNTELYPKGYMGAGKCANCHGSKLGVNAPFRSKDGVNSFPR